MHTKFKCCCLVIVSRVYWIVTWRRKLIIMHVHTDKNSCCGQMVAVAAIGSGNRQSPRKWILLLFQMNFKRKSTRENIHRRRTKIYFCEITRYFVTDVVRCFLIALLYLFWMNRGSTSLWYIIYIHMYMRNNVMDLWSTLWTQNNGICLR